MFLCNFIQLLGRVFNILRENNPELAGDRRRTVMRPPQVLREGTKKTVFVNFMDLCKTYYIKSLFTPSPFFVYFVDIFFSEGFALSWFSLDLYFPSMYFAVHGYIIQSNFTFMIKSLLFLKKVIVNSLYMIYYNNFVFPLYRMHRQPEHVMAFLLAEMGTSGSLDGQQRVVVKGRFAPKNFEGILRRYVSKFISYLEVGIC